MKSTFKDNPSARFTAVLCGGGTGGHLYPGLAIADGLKSSTDCDIHFVGTRRGIEFRVVPEYGYSLHTVWIAGIHRGRVLGNLLFPLKMAVSLIQALGILLRLKPAIVIGTGGYASWPVIRAAILLRIPSVLQEQNQFPGLVTRVLASRVDQVQLSFESTKSVFKRQDHLIVSGNPTRDNLEIRRSEKGYTTFGLHPNKKTLFIFGGSQGARGINQWIIRSMHDLLEIPNLQILWSTGPRWIDEIKSEVGDDNASVRLLPYISDMGLAYSISDLILCRSGATTVAELTRIGIPAVFIPFPGAAEGHQLANARVVEQAGAAVVLTEEKLTQELLTETIRKLITDDEGLKIMREKSGSLGHPEATKNIVKNLLNLIR